MPTINISVKNKIATAANDVVVCGNTDYTIEFDFDSEWNGYEAKTARFVWNGQYVDVAFAGHRATMPAIEETLYVAVGVYSGNLHTTTPAILTAKKSILCGTDQPHPEPPEDVYNQLIELINQLPEALEAAENARESAESAEQSASSASASATAASNSATAAAGSALSASESAESAFSASNSASNFAESAFSSASSASNSATAAGQSASAAYASATSASNSATAAGNSATSANESATNASTSESNASASATSAANSAESASASASAAETSKNSASNSATAAETSATNASASATAASNSATSASESATSASGSATAASNSATSAAASATAAANSAESASASATAAESTVSETVRYDISQDKTDSKKSQARTNIGAASAADVTALEADVEMLETKNRIQGMQIANLKSIVYDTVIDDAEYTFSDLDTETLPTHISDGTDYHKVFTGSELMIAEIMGRTVVSEGSLVDSEISGIRINGAEGSEAEPWELDFGDTYVLKGARTDGDRITVVQNANGLYDVVKETRMKTVDLGTLTWTYSSTRDWFFGRAEDVWRAGASARPVAICTGYVGIDPNHLADGKFMIHSTSGYGIYIKDSRYSTASEFKEAVSGVMLTYLLLGAYRTSETLMTNLTENQIACLTEQGGSIKVVGNGNSAIAKPDVKAIMQIEKAVE